MKRPLFFQRGEELYPHLEELFQNARKEILFCVYGFHLDRIGNRFLAILESRARAGVKVRLIFDAIGSWGDHGEIVRRLSAAGGEARIFRSESYFWLRPFSYFYRNHARLCMVDNKAVGLGGICIGEVYEKREDGFLFLDYKDTSKFQKIFEGFWRLATAYGVLRVAAGVLPGDPQQPGVLLSGPNYEEQQVFAWLIERVRRAEKRVILVATWFLPPRELLDELLSAQKRGIKVSIITPLRTDRHRYDAFRAMPITPLVDAGISWYGHPEYFHHKFFIIDDEWAFGSANCDLLSFKRNYELDLTGTGGPILEFLEQDAVKLTAGLRPHPIHEIPRSLRIASNLLYAWTEILLTAGVRRRIWSGRRPAL